MTNARKRISEKLKSIAGDEFIRIFQTFPQEKKDAMGSALWTAIPDLIHKKHGLTNEGARAALGDGSMWLTIPFGGQSDVQGSLEGIVPPGSAEQITADLVHYLTDRIAEIAYAPFSQEEQDRVFELDELPRNEVAAAAKIELDRIDQKLSTVGIVLHVLELKQQGSNGEDDEG